MSTYELPETAENLWAEQVTIASGASESDGFPTQGRALIGIILPAAWTAGDLAYKSSLDGKTFRNLITDGSGGVIRTVADATKNDIAFPLSDAPFRPFLKLVSIDASPATTTVAVNQGAARVIILLFRRYLGGQ